VDGIIKNSHPEIKVKLLNDIFQSVEMLLQVKDKQRENNKDGKH
jgi:hypothetical protein